LELTVVVVGSTYDAGTTPDPAPGADGAAFGAVVNCGCGISSRSNWPGTLTVAGPGSKFFEDWPTMSCPLEAVKIGTRLISACVPPTSSHGTQML
jgi:hypothetical protein